MMIATVNEPNYPYFDMSEIIPEIDFIFKPYKPMKPLKKGDNLPGFSYQKDSSKWRQFLNGVGVRGPVLLNQLLNKPLVLSFYSQHWQQQGLDLLKQLNTIQNDITTNNSNLLVISSENDKDLEKIALKNNLSLFFYFDTKNEIAEKFKIYSETDPIWNKFSGIDINVPLLATYVISPPGQIVYDHVDLDFSKPFPAKDIISVIKKAGSLKIR